MISEADASPRSHTRQRQALFSALGVVLVVTVGLGVWMVGDLGRLLGAEVPGQSDAEIIEANWGVDVPDTAHSTASAQSELGFQGDGWRATVFEVPDESHIGVFDPSLFEDGNADPATADVAQQSYEELLDPSGVPAPTEDTVCVLTAQKDDGSDSLVICHEPGADTFVLFEAIS